MKKKKSLKIKPVFLLAAATVLLLASTVGSTQAALTYYSENYMAEVTVSNIGVKLLENGAEVSRRNYVGTDKEEWDDTNVGTLFAGGKLKEICYDENGKIKEIKEVNASDLVLGKKYQEELKVENSGAIDSYVRMIITKSWNDATGKKDTTLSPALIDLKLNKTDDKGNVVWIEDEKASTPERTVLYYKNILKVGETTPACTDTVRIDPAISTKVIETVSTDAEGLKTITFVYEYDGYTFNIEAEVDAVQTHNAADAIKSAWGIDVAVAADGSISLK